jgi:hypothetical protein
MKVGFRAFTPADALTIRNAMPFNFSQDVKGLVAYDKDTFETLAVLVAQDWTFTTVQVHQVILKSLVIRHGWFQEIADWLFLRANRLKLLAPIIANNEQALSLNKKLGFTEVVRIKDGYDYDVDIVLMELVPENANANLWKPKKLAEVA